MQASRARSDRHAERQAFAYGVVGVVIFGMTLPATRLAVMEIDPFIVALGRAVIAGALAALVVVTSRIPAPERADWGRLARYSLGVVLGFPVLATVAMTYAPAAHGGIILAILPLATAVASVVVAGERPSPAFWLCAVAGSAAVLLYAWLHGISTSQGFHWADLLLFAAVASAAWGYAEGAMLSRKIGGWQAISWALTVSFPVMLLLTVIAASRGMNWSASPAAWAGFAYVAVFSMFIGFFAWNRALVLGGIAKVGQVQLLQTFVTLGGAAVLLGEPVGALELGFAIIVAIIVLLGWRTRVGRPLGS